MSISGTNIGTSKIEVFPSARRVRTQASARLFSESSFVNIINKLIDTKGYVVTPETDDNTATYIGFKPIEKFDFNIFGYYFTVEKASDIISLAGSSDLDIYASIVLDTDGNFAELTGQDDNGVYEGLIFTSTAPSDSDVGEYQKVYSLLLFQRASTSSAWYIPSSSRVKFTYGFPSGVDGGIL